MINFFVGLLLSVIISALAVKKGKLTFNAGLTAVAVGASAYGFGGPETGIALFAFFASAVLTARFKKRVDFNSAVKARKVSQTLANGLPAAAFALIYYITNNQIFLFSSISAIACATADTWSSDIGILSKGATVSILTLRKIKAGQSGGISLLGCVSSILGSVFTGSVYIIVSLVRNPEIVSAYPFFLISVCGAAGSFADSILGASIQAKYRYQDKIIEEKEKHMINAKLISGFGFVNNDAVNMLSGFIAGTICVAASVLMNIY